MTYSEYLDSLTPAQAADLNSFITFMANMIIKYHDKVESIIKETELNDKKNAPK